MSADSYQAGFDRGRVDGEDGRPQAQPRKDLATADANYIRFWLEGYPRLPAGRARTAGRRPPHDRPPANPTTERSIPMTPQRTLDMPGDPTQVEEAAAILHEHTTGDDTAFTRHAWRWACHVASDQAQAETAYFAVLTAGGVTPPAAADPDPDPDPEPEPAAPEPKPAPDPEQEPDAPDTDDDPEPAQAPIATLDPEPLPDKLAQQLYALTQRVEATEPHVAAPVPRYDPEETPTLAGQVAVVEWADLRQRAGAVRIILLRTETGPIEAWCSWQQLAALIRGEELAHGRTLQAGDLLAIRAAGKQRIGKSRSPSRLFSVAVEWAK